MVVCSSKLLVGACAAQRTPRTPHRRLGALLHPSVHSSLHPALCERALQAQAPPPPPASSSCIGDGSASRGAGCCTVGGEVGGAPAPVAAAAAAAAAGCPPGGRLLAGPAVAAAPETAVVVATEGMTPTPDAPIEPSCLLAPPPPPPTVAPLIFSLNTVGTVGAAPTAAAAGAPVCCCPCTPERGTAEDAPKGPAAKDACECKRWGGGRMGR